MGRYPTRVMKASQAFRSRLEEQRFLIDYMIFLPLIIAAVMGNMVAITTLQTDKGRLYDVNLQQFQMLTAGIAITFFAALIVTREIKPRFDFRIQSRDEFIMSAMFAMGAFSGARLAAALASATFNKIYNLGLSSYDSVTQFWGTGFPIVFVSAVYEEILFSLGIGTAAYLMCQKGLIILLSINNPGRIPSMADEQTAHILSVLIVTPVIGIFFAQLHIGVYGSDPSLMVYLFAARCAYTAVYLLTKNAMAPIIAHVLHNFTVSMI